MAAEYCLDKVLTFDKLRLIKMMNDVPSKIRAKEARQSPEELRKTRYLFLKNPFRLTDEQEQLPSVHPESHKLL